MSSAFKEITSPTPYRVYQRSGDYAADIEVAGTLRGGKGAKVEFRITDSGWQRAEVKGERFSGVLEKVPVGGPYTVELRINGGSATRRIPGLLVGDLWILAGQSNMDGCGKLVNLEPPSRMVHAFHYDETWGIARDPICWVHESIDPVHWNTDDPEKRAEFNRQNRAFRTIGAGLGVRFGKDMYKATGVPIGLLVCSHGGTSMDQWNPELKSQGGKSLYGSMMRRVGVAGGRVAGCLWYQGESDVLGPDAGESYKEKTRRLIESIRADLKQPDMPFIHVQLAPFYSGEAKLIKGWNRVQTAQLALESEMRNVAVVPAIDCTLSDSIHVDAASLRRLGARMALLARKLWFGAKDIPYGPRLAGCSFADKERTKLRVKFTGANGVLRPVSRIVGFSVLVKDEPREIKSCMRDGGDGTSVALTLAEPVPKGAVLWYGRGLNPACNLSDSAGFPVPVFGPVRLA